MEFLIVFFVAAITAFEHNEKIPDSSLEGVKDSRILGGHFASFGQFPWQAAVHVYGEDEKQKRLCGGALVEDQWILTAARCTKEAKKYVIYLGSTNIARESETGRQVLESTEALIHENYNETTLNNDVALLKLAEKVTFNSTIKKITIADSSDYIGSELQATIIGWGTAPNTGEDVLKSVNVTTISNNDCQGVYGKDVITENTLCTVGNPEQTLCAGDNGGPLIVTDSRNEVVHAGIISSILEDSCSPSVPGRYIRTANYYDWIKSRTDTSGSNSVYNVYMLPVVLAMLFKQFVL